MYINVHLEPMERRLVARRQVCWLDAGNEPAHLSELEMMFKIIYSSPYASHETAMSSHIVKY